MADGQKWSISYTDVFNKKTVESFDSQGEAQSRYEALIPRTYGDLGDLVSVSAPVKKVTEAFEGKGIDWDSIQDIFHKYIIAGDSPNSLPVKSGGYTLEKGSIHGVLKDSSGKPLFGLDYDFSDDTRGDIFVANIGMSPADFAKVKDIAWDIAKECDNGYYSAYVHTYADEDGYHKDSLNDFGKNDYARACGIFDEDCGGASAASLGAVPTGVVGRKSESKKNESENPIAAIYGDGGINTYQHSADGFFAERTHPIGFAILTNDTDALSHLYHCDAVPPKDAYQYIGWSEVEDDDGNYDGYEYNWNDGYEKEFIDDWQRVIGETPNEDALKLMLSYDPDFFVCPADFSNALHAGYDKDILKKLFYNVRALRDDDDDLRINYFGDSDYVSADSPDPIANIEAFLDASESCKSEALPPKPWNGKTRKFPSRAALVKKAKELRATEIGDFDDYTKKNKDLFLDKIGFAMDINGNSVARLWWGENNGKYYYSTSRDVLDKTV